MALDVVAQLRDVGRGVLDVEHGVRPGVVALPHQLVQVGEILADQIRQADGGDARQRTIDDFRTNTYDAATGTLTYTDAQANAFEALEAYLAEELRPGLPAVVAEGITIVTPAVNRAYLQNAMSAPRTLAPDSLSKSGKKPQVEGFTGDKRVFQDGTRTFEVRAIDASGNPDPTPARFEWTGVKSSYTPRIYCVQYDETVGPNWPDPTD